MRRLLYPALVLALCAGIVALIVFGVARKGDDRGLDSAVARGERPVAPDRSLPMLGAPGERSLATYRGKVVVLNFWASWCTPCAAEAPALEKAQARYGPRGVTILGVDWNDTEPDANTFIRRHHLTYPILRDVGGKLARDYGTNGLPETFVIDRQGRVTALQRYQVDSGFLDRTLASLAGKA